MEVCYRGRSQLILEVQQNIHGYPDKYNARNFWKVTEELNANSEKLSEILTQNRYRLPAKFTKNNTLSDPVTTCLVGAAWQDRRGETGWPGPSATWHAAQSAGGGGSDCEQWARMDGFVSGGTRDQSSRPAAVGSRPPRHGPAAVSASTDRHVGHSVTSIHTRAVWLRWSGTILLIALVRHILFYKSRCSLWMLCIGWK